jgi:hypothetical protein
VHRGPAVTAGRVMHASTVDVWKLIQQAGPNGLSMDEIKAALPNLTDVPKRVTNLRGMSYIRPTSAEKRPRYAVTSKVPLAAIASGKALEDDASVEAELRAEARSKAVHGVPPGVPSSIFHLGQMHATSASAEPTAADVAKAAPAPAAPAPAPAGPFSLPRLEIPTLKPLRAQLQARQPAEPDRSMGGPVRQAPTPRFELHSDDALLIDPAGDGAEPITLTPTVTRHLFRWLDRIGGLQLSRLVASDSTETTS